MTWAGRPGHASDQLAALASMAQPDAVLVLAPDGSAASSFLTAWAGPAKYARCKSPANSYALSVTGIRIRPLPPPAAFLGLATSRASDNVPSQHRPTICNIVTVLIM